MGDFATYSQEWTAWKFLQRASWNSKMQENPPECGDIGDPIFQRQLLHPNQSNTVLNYWRITSYLLFVGFILLSRKPPDVIQFILCWVFSGRFRRKVINNRTATTTVTTEVHYNGTVARFAENVFRWNASITDTDRSVGSQSNRCPGQRSSSIHSYVVKATTSTRTCRAGINYKPRWRAVADCAVLLAEDILANWLAQFGRGKTASEKRPIPRIEGSRSISPEFFTLPRVSDLLCHVTDLPSTSRLPSSTSRLYLSSALHDSSLSVTISVGAQLTWGARHFCPKMYVWKIN